MQPKKRANSDHSNMQRGTKRMRGSDLAEVSPEVAVAAQRTQTNQSNQNLISIDLHALSASISTTISRMIQQALESRGTHSLAQDPSSVAVVCDGEHSFSAAIQGEITALTQGTLPQSSLQQPFSSIAIALGSRVNPKTKAKIWSNVNTWPKCDTVAYLFICVCLLSTTQSKNTKMKFCSTMSIK